MKPFDESAIVPGSLSDRVIQYNYFVVDLVAKAKQPGFSRDDFTAREALVNIAEFRRIAANKGQRTWQEDVASLYAWAPTADFSNRIRRIAESDNVVYLDIEENVTADGVLNSVNTLAVYEFDPAGKIVRVTSYQQVDA